jgi:DNA-binding NarL/FixJ family response regulator
VADDHPLVLEGIRNALGTQVELLGAVEDGRALIAAAQQQQPDVVLLDISMPGMGGIEAARQLKKKAPDAKVIFVTMHGDPGYVREALRVGADGYVLKRSAVSELVTAIEEVLKGNTYVSPAVLAYTSQPWPSQVRPAKKLTTRQREVLQLISEGRTAKQIGAALGVSQKTAEFHKSAIMAKLGLRTIADLTKYAVRHRLTEKE